MLQIAPGIQDPKNHPDIELFKAAEENYWNEEYWKF